MSYAGLQAEFSFLELHRQTSTSRVEHFVGTEVPCKIGGTPLNSVTLGSTKCPQLHRSG